MDLDTTRKSQDHRRVDQNDTAQVRRDSKATLRTLGSSATRCSTSVRERRATRRSNDGDTISLANALDYEAVLRQASGARLRQELEARGMTLQDRLVPGPLSDQNARPTVIVAKKQLSQMLDQAFGQLFLNQWVVVAVLLILLVGLSKLACWN